MEPESLLTLEQARKVAAQHRLLLIEAAPELLTAFQHDAAQQELMRGEVFAIVGPDYLMTDVHSAFELLVGFRPFAPELAAQLQEHLELLICRSKAAPA